jgi:hypothetical protein
VESWFCCNCLHASYASCLEQEVGSKITKQNLGISRNPDIHVCGNGREIKSEKGKSLISKFEEKRDAQSVYFELEKQALGSTAAQLSGDMQLQYITTA